MQPHETAAAAADYIAEHGHTKGTLMDDEGRVCFLGALDAVAPRESIGDWARAAENEGRVTVTVADMLGLDSPDRAYSNVLSPERREQYRKTRAVVQWNNDPERTADEVIDALRDASVKLTPDLTGATL